MNFSDTILDNLRKRFGQDDLGEFLPDFTIERYGKNLEFVAPNGALLYIADKGPDFALYTTHVDNPYRWTFEDHSLTTDDASNFILGFITANI